MTIDMTAVIAKATELDHSIANVKKALKRVSSMKCNLNKATNRPDFNAKMTACLQEEELLKRVRDYITGPRKNVNTLEETDIAAMSYDEVCRAIRAIQSKKYHTKWADDCKKDENGIFIPGSGESYQEACRIEDMLKARRDEIQPVGTKHFSKSELLDLLEVLKGITDLDAATCIARIEAFLEGAEPDEA